jgi:hypothetical protein
MRRHVEDILEYRAFQKNDPVFKLPNSDFLINYENEWVRDYFVLGKMLPFTINKYFHKPRYATVPFNPMNRSFHGSDEVEIKMERFRDTVSFIDSLVDKVLTRTMIAFEDDYLNVLKIDEIVHLLTGYEAKQVVVNECVHTSYRAYTSGRSDYIGIYRSYNGIKATNRRNLRSSFLHLFKNNGEYCYDINSKICFI